MQLAYEPEAFVSSSYVYRDNAYLGSITDENYQKVTIFSNNEYSIHLRK